MQDRNVEIHFVKSFYKLADIFMKDLPDATFVHILQGLRMMEV